MLVLFRLRGEAMPSPIRTVFEAAPDDALALISQANDRTAESKTDIINWCIYTLGRARPTHGFYWIPQGSTEPIKIDLTPVTSTSTTKVTVNLSRHAWTALAECRQRFRCEDDDVLARAARLAAYYDRRDGRLGHGYVAGGQRAYARLLHIVR